MNLIIIINIYDKFLKLIKKYFFCLINVNKIKLYYN